MTDRYSKNRQNKPHTGLLDQSTPHKMLNLFAKAVKP